VITIVPRIAEPAQGRGLCIGLAHPAAAKLLRPEIEVHAHLVVRVLPESLARHGEPKEAAYAAREER
jgi:hypothetical protein